VYLGEIAPWLGIGLFVGMLICSEFGRRLGLARLAHDADGLEKGTSTAEAAVFGLIGLLIAFTFSGAASRFEDRRHLIREEVNAIGTAYLRLDLLPIDSQPELRELFRHYVDVRSITYSNAEDRNATASRLTEGAALQGDIWTKAVAACLKPGTPPQATVILLPALNEMIDITTTRIVATRNHPPLIIFLLLGMLSLIGALLVGYGISPNKERSWLHIMVFAAIISLTVFVILDIEYPRLGMIQIDAADQLFFDLKKGMH
jgi:hypothetical protein